MPVMTDTTTTTSPAILAAGDEDLAWPPPGRITPRRRANTANLLDAAGAGPADSVLIVGAPNATLMCETLRHGCRAALEVTSPPRRPEPADVVVAPRIATEDAAAAIAACAHRALAESRHGGRLALSLLGSGARAMLRAVGRRLRAYGFERIRLRAQAEGDIMLICHLRGTTRH